MTPARKHIAIVGGGTAGWLAALILAEGARRSKLDIAFTMVESSRIPSVGVGEGSTAVMRQLFAQLDIDELEFLAETEATIKFGIRHKDWRRLGHTYDGPIDDPHQIFSAPPGVRSSWLDQYCVASDRSVTEPHLFSYLLDRKKSPFARSTDGGLVPLGPFHHAYHFDQALVAKFLRKKATGIAHIDAEVTGVHKHPETGDISELVLEKDRTLPVDFVVDCTGFRRALIGKEMGAKWHSFADALPVNRAMPFWVNIKQDEEINPYTLAWAQKAGWMWSIPTRSRYGCGYVYSDHFTSPDQAQAEIETTLGHKIEPRNDIKINSGRLDNVWMGNCLAVGLASSFLEPLEATSIHGTIVQLMLFSQEHLATDAASLSKRRASYNSIVAGQVDDFMSFINLHYVSERDDSAFWRAVKNEFILPITKDRLRLWQSHLPRRDDFATFPHQLPHIEQQLYMPVLDGLGLLDKNLAKSELAANPKLRAHARKTVASLSKEYKQASTKALGHKDFLHAFANNRTRS